jgi:succinate-semialdehyde dehydrogenase/glutarate-semialdehyde dehydrogenase
MVRSFLLLVSTCTDSPSPSQVGANTGAISQVGIPFGGIKESGFGREGAFPPFLGSKYGLQDWQNIKLIAIGGL